MQAKPIELIMELLQGCFAVEAKDTEIIDIDIEVITRFNPASTLRTMFGPLSEAKRASRSKREELQSCSLAL